MLRPVAQAQPAELTPALAAHHVHAALVLLYGPLALGAGLGVGQDPIGILTLSTVLPQPQVDSLTVHLHSSMPGGRGQGDFLEILSPGGSCVVLLCNWRTPGWCCGEQVASCMLYQHLLQAS